jgi:hypothetical protein
MTAGAFAATARAEAATTRVWVKTGTIAARAVVSAPAPTVVRSLGPFASLVCVVAEPPYHLPGKHDNPIALGTDVGLVLVVLFVGCKLVACRLVPPENGSETSRF